MTPAADATAPEGSEEAPFGRSSGPADRASLAEGSLHLGRRAPPNQRNGAEADQPEGDRDTDRDQGGLPGGDPAAVNDRSCPGIVWRDPHGECAGRGDTDSHDAGQQAGDGGGATAKVVGNG